MADGALVSLYRDKFARIGLAIFAVAIAVTAAHPFLPGHAEVHRALYYGAVAGAVAGEVVFTVHARRFGWDDIRTVHARAFLWGATQVGWITLGMGASGGGRSPLLLLYVLTTVAYVTHLPAAGQLGLLATTIAMYSTMALVTDTWPGWGPAALLFAVLGAVQVQASRPTVELYGYLEEVTAARDAAERRLRAELAAREKAERLDQLKRDFIQTSSHELRTPLTAIKGMSSILDERWPQLSDDERRLLLQRVRHNADAIVALLDTYLDYGRLASGRVEAAPAPFDLSATVEQIVERLRSLLGDRRLVVDVAPHVVVEADRQLVEQVVVNLIANETQHARDHGTVEVLVTADGSDARVTVRDDGPGIAAGDLRHLGEPFFRGAAATERAGRGSGLGLSFCKEVLDLHGRTLDVQSEVGRGSSFSFSLPLAA